MLMLQFAYDFVPAVAVDAASKRRDTRRMSFNCQFFGTAHDNRAGVVKSRSGLTNDTRRFIATLFCL
jgi:hypothetical protein